MKQWTRRNNKRSHLFRNYPRQGRQATEYFFRKFAVRHVVFDEQNFVFSFLVADRSQAANEVALRVAGMTRPRVDRDDYPLIVQLRRLSSLDSHSWDFPFSGNENVTSGALEDVRLDDSAVLSPLASDDADNLSGRLPVVHVAFFVQQRFGCLLVINRVIGRIGCLVFQNYFTRRNPLLFRQNFNSDDVTVDGSIKGCATLQKNSFFKGFNVDTAFQVVFS